MDFYNRRRFDRCCSHEPFWCEPRCDYRRESCYGGYPYGGGYPYAGYPYWGNRFYNSPLFIDNYYYY